MGIIYKRTNFGLKILHCIMCIIFISSFNGQIGILRDLGAWVCFGNTHDMYTLVYSLGL